MHCLKWSQEHPGIIWGADMAEKKDPLLNELFHQVGQHQVGHHGRKEARSGERSLFWPWDPTPEKDWQISFSPKQSDVGDINWQQFMSPALPAPFGQEHGRCRLAGCGACSTSVGYPAGVSALCTDPRAHGGQFLFSLPPVKSHTVQTFKMSPTRWPKKKLHVRNSVKFSLTYPCFNSLKKEKDFENCLRKWWF